MPCRSCLVGLLSVLMLSCTLAAQTSPPVEPFKPFVPTDSEVEVLAPGSPGAAGELAAAARCHESMPRAALVALGWRPAGGETGAAQRVDISKLRDGFATDRFATTRILPAATAAISIEAPEPGINYYWRVLTASPGGWLPSVVERFEVPICPFDPIEEGRFPSADPPTPGSEDPGEEG
jgi:hypothetical protein